MDPQEIQRISHRLGRLWVERCQRRPSAHPQQPQRHSILNERFLQQIRHHSEHVRRYEDWDLQEKCRSIIPVDRLHNEARDEMQRNNQDSFEDAIVKRLLFWFKHEFFKWVNQPSCTACLGDTKIIGYAEPTAEELRGEAGRVEEYECQNCRQRQRFPRYGDPKVLLEPQNRRGRCGEWANVFTLFCRSLGYDTRYVVDWTDHVWTEYYSDRLDRWIHLDSCEAAFDTPLVYEVGWGKRLSYCLAFSVDEVVDVSRRYTRDWAQMLTRRQSVSEAALYSCIAGINAQLGAQQSAEKREFLRKRREREQIEWQLAAQKTISQQEMVGRQSGSVEWRKERGELGADVGDKPFHSLKSQSPPVSSLASMRSIRFSPQNTRLNGSARWINSPATIQLTPARNDCRGSVWLLNDGNASADPAALLIDTSKNFAVEFTFHIRKGGADGMALVLHKDPRGLQALGEGGSGLGYAGLRNALSLELDSYQAVDRCADPNGNHLSIQCVSSSLTDGSSPLSAHHSQSIGCTAASNIPLPILNDSADPLHCLFYHDAALKTLTVWLSDKKSDEGDMLGAEYLCVLQVTSLQLRDRLGADQVLVGFTAATGGLNQEHLVMDAKIFF